jgi:hypothetical protein
MLQIYNKNLIGTNQKIGFNRFIFVFYLIILFINLNFLPVRLIF